MQNLRIVTQGKMREGLRERGAGRNAGVRVHPPLQQQEALPNALTGSAERTRKLTSPTLKRCRELTVTMLLLKDHIRRRK